jgi:hypothetical protein
VISRIGCKTGRIAKIEAGIGDDFFQFLLGNRLLHESFNVGHDGGCLFNSRALGGGDEHRKVSCVDLREKFRMEAGQQRDAHDPADGADRAPARAMLKGTGFTDEEIASFERRLEELRAGDVAESAA